MQLIKNYIHSRYIPAVTTVGGITVVDGRPTVVTGGTGLVVGSGVVLDIEGIFVVPTKSSGVDVVGPNVLAD